MKYQHDKELIDKTREILEKGSGKIDESLFPGFTLDIADDDKKKEDCILVMGINPAGGEIDRIREELGQTFYYYAGERQVGFTIKEPEKYGLKSAANEKKPKWHWTYKTYYKPLFKLAQDAGLDVKWGWCNRDWDEDLQKEIEKIGQEEKFKDIRKFKDDLLDFYRQHHNNGTTIYIGDMFYYHDTDQSNVSKQLKSDGEKKKDRDARLKEYCEEMLRLHIDILEKHNKNIKYIHINNKEVCDYLLYDPKNKKTFNSKNESAQLICKHNNKEYNVFCSRILSNGGSDKMKEDLRKRIKELL